MDLKQNVSFCLYIIFPFQLHPIVDVICGTPCQGISGFSHYGQNPLQDPKNKHLKVFMDMVDFLRPRFVLMKNAVDLLKFSNGFLGRYAVSRLLGMNFQARLGMLSVGAYGLPQFCMLVFMWGVLRERNCHNIHCQHTMLL